MELYIVIFSFLLDLISFIFILVFFMKNARFSFRNKKARNKKNKILDETKKLTRRELEVLEKIYQNSNLPYKQIASLLFISEKTISMHTYNISKKINVKNRRENLLNFYEENLKEKVQYLNFRFPI